VAGHAYPSGFWHDIFFIDSLHGWGTGYWYTFSGSGTDTTVIVNTTNDADWLPLLSNIGNHPLYKIFFLDHQKGWVTGATGIILSTQDGGQNWTREAEGMTNEWLSGLQFTSPHNGYICGNNMTLLKYGQISGEEETGGPGDREKEEVEVWPNPTRGKFQITNSKHQAPNSKQIQNSNYPMTQTKRIPCKEFSFWKLEFGICDLSLTISYSDHLPSTAN